jgi:circadian clock protein KaiC
VAGSFDLSGLIERINYAIRKYKAKRVVIDSITAVFQQYDAVFVVRREIFRLIARLKEIGVTTVMTTERIDEYGPIARYGVEEFVSDNVVILRNVLEGERRRRTVEILKLRGTTHMKGEFPFTMGAHGISIFPLGAMRLTQRSSNVRVSSGVPRLDEIAVVGSLKTQSSWPLVQRALVKRCWCRSLLKMLAVIRNAPFFLPMKSPVHS